MYNNASIQAVDKSRFSKRFVKPLYDSYCFSKIPDTILQLLTGKAKAPLPVDVVGGSWEKADVVVVFLVDGFGWDFFQRFGKNQPFLRRYEESGVVSKITSEFPSTTAAHVTTIHSGLDVGESGIYEWFYYEPLVDKIISPLTFSYAGDHRLDTLLESKIDPSSFYPQKTFYQDLEEKGIKSFVFQQEGISDSVYSKMLTRGAKIIPFGRFQDGLQKVAEVCKEASGPTYLFFYLGDIDAVGHRQGIESDRFYDTIDACWKGFEECFAKSLKTNGKKVATIVTADHGMVGVNPQTTHYLNQVFPDICDFFKRNRQGEPLVPAGSCRDFFLHVEEKHFTSCKDLLEKRFQSVAEIYATEDLIGKGFFGPNPSQKFKSRVGNLVILPYENESIWWFSKHKFEQHFHAAHGGLEKKEMESIFLFLSW